MSRKSDSAKHDKDNMDHNDTVDSLVEESRIFNEEFERMMEELNRKSPAKKRVNLFKRNEEPTTIRRSIIARAFQPIISTPMLSSHGNLLRDRDNTPNLSPITLDKNTSKRVENEENFHEQLSSSTRRRSLRIINKSPNPEVINISDNSKNACKVVPDPEVTSSKRRVRKVDQSGSTGKNKLTRSKKNENDENRKSPEKRLKQAYSPDGQDTPETQTGSKKLVANTAKRLKSVIEMMSQKRDSSEFSYSIHLDENNPHFEGIKKINCHHRRKSRLTTTGTNKKVQTSLKSSVHEDNVPSNVGVEVSMQRPSTSKVPDVDDNEDIVDAAEKNTLQIEKHLLSNMDVNVPTQCAASTSMRRPSIDDNEENVDAALKQRKDDLDGFINAAEIEKLNYCPKMHDPYRIDVMLAPRVWSPSLGEYSDDVTSSSEEEYTTRPWRYEVVSTRKSNSCSVNFLRNISQKKFSDAQAGESDSSEDINNSLGLAQNSGASHSRFLRSGDEESRANTLPEDRLYITTRSAAKKNKSTICDDLGDDTHNKKVQASHRMESLIDELTNLAKKKSQVATNIQQAQSTSLRHRIESMNKSLSSKNRRILSPLCSNEKSSMVNDPAASPENKQNRSRVVSPNASANFCTRDNSDSIVSSPAMSHNEKESPVRNSRTQSSNKKGSLSSPAEIGSAATPIKKRLVFPIESLPSAENSSGKIFKSPKKPGRKKKALVTTNTREESTSSGGTNLCTRDNSDSIVSSPLLSKKILVGKSPAMSHNQKESPVRNSRAQSPNKKGRLSSPAEIGPAATPIEKRLVFPVESGPSTENASSKIFKSPKKPGRKRKALVTTNTREESAASGGTASSFNTEGLRRSGRERRPPPPPSNVQILYISGSNRIGFKEYFESQANSILRNSTNVSSVSSLQSSKINETSSVFTKQEISRKKIANKPVLKKDTVKKRGRPRKLENLNGESVLPNESSSVAQSTTTIERDCEVEKDTAKKNKKGKGKKQIPAKSKTQKQELNSNTENILPAEHSSFAKPGTSRTTSRSDSFDLVSLNMPEEEDLCVTENLNQRSEEESHALKQQVVDKTVKTDTVRTRLRSRNLSLVRKSNARTSITAQTSETKNQMEGFSEIIQDHIDEECKDREPHENDSELANNYLTRSISHINVENSCTRTPKPISGRVTKKYKINSSLTKYLTSTTSYTVDGETFELSCNSSQFPKCGSQVSCLTNPLNGNKQGVLKIKPNTITSLRRSRDFEMHFFVLDGTAMAQVNNRKIPLKTFRHFLVPVGNEYCIQNLNPRKDLVLGYAAVK